MNKPKIRERHIVIAWLVFMLASFVVGYIGQSVILSVTHGLQDQDSKLFHVIAMFIGYSISLIVSYFVFWAIVSKFIVPKVSVSQD
jgi:lysylphosphatidylglycerol synthetase-like protein (DUF2156 family)